MTFPRLYAFGPLLAAFLLASSLGGLAQPALPFEAPVTSTSVSGQFVVHGRDSSPPPAARELRPVGDDPVIQLRPDLLAVSCERVKKAILFRLDVRDAWRGKVHLHLQRQPLVERPIAIRPQLNREGWQYHLAVPDRVEWPRLVRALTEVVLLELANRENAGNTPVQLPLWLTEGCHQLALGDYGRDLVIESQTTLNRSARKPDPLRVSRDTLKGREPLGFSVLTLATVDTLGNPAAFTEFQANAALLVHELTEPPLNARTHTFVRALSANLNWQTTFLQVFRDQFATLLEAEKWWAVNATHELARDPALQWSRGEVLARLQEILTETAAVRPAGETSPVQQTLPLSEVVAAWDFPTQEAVLRRKTAQLQLLSLRTPPALQPLVADCFRTLERYLAERQAAGADVTSRGTMQNRGPVLARATARKLESLSRQVAEEQRKG